MSSLHKVSSVISRPALGKVANRRKHYRKPQLKELGDLRTLTLGGSPGTGDSQSGSVRMNPSSLPQPGGFPPMPEGFIKPGEVP